MNQNILEQVFEIIQLRKVESPEKSYTASLFAKGENQILKKIGEESTELVMASVRRRTEEIVCETADLLFHILVLLAYKDIEIQEVFAELESRMGISGLEEKASRGKNDRSGR